MSIAAEMSKLLEELEIAHGEEEASAAALAKATPMLLKPFADLGTPSAVIKKLVEWDVRMSTRVADSINGTANALELIRVYVLQAVENEVLGTCEAAEKPPVLLPALDLQGASHQHPHRHPRKHRLVGSASSYRAPPPAANPPHESQAQLPPHESQAQLHASSSLPRLLPAIGPPPPPTPEVPGSKGDGREAAATAPKDEAALAPATGDGTAPERGNRGQKKKRAAAHKAAAAASAAAAAAGAATGSGSLGACTASGPHLPRSLRLSTEGEDGSRDEVLVSLSGRPPVITDESELATALGHLAAALTSPRDLNHAPNTSCHHCELGASASTGALPGCAPGLPQGRPSVLGTSSSAGFLPGLKRSRRSGSACREVGSASRRVGGRVPSAGKSPPPQPRSLPAGGTLPPLPVPSLPLEKLPLLPPLRTPWEAPH